MNKDELRTPNIEHRTPNEAAAAAWGIHDGEVGGRKYDLEERLLGFASAMIDLSEKLPASRAGNRVAHQILRSGTLPYPNHGEAESAESREDFAPKLKVCLKELRETRRWARLIDRNNWTEADATLRLILSESEELIRIFAASIQTVRRNALAQRRRPPDAAHRPPGGAG